MTVHSSWNTGAHAATTVRSNCCSVAGCARHTHITTGGPPVAGPLLKHKLHSLTTCSLLVLPALLRWLLWFSLRVSRRCCRSWASCGTGHHQGCGWAPAHAAGTAADMQQQRPPVSEKHSTEQHLQTPLMLSASSRNLRSLANPIVRSLRCAMCSALGALSALAARACACTLPLFNLQFIQTTEVWWLCLPAHCLQPQPPTQCTAGSWMQFPLLFEWSMYCNVVYYVSLLT
jgi:hypothetical protein